MKKLVIFILSLMAVGVALSFMFTVYPTFTGSGTSFFLFLDGKQYDQAYEMFDDKFKANTSQEQFIDMLKQVGLDKYKSVEWVKTVADEKAGYAVILGVVTTYDDKKIPVQFRFVQWKNQNGEPQGWQITSIRTHESANEGLY